MGFEADLPGGSHGAAPTGFASLLEGLKFAGTAKGSMVHTGLSTTDVAITFEITSGALSGNLAGYMPLELHVRLWDGTTQVAGRWNSNLTGDSDTTTRWGVVAASGITIINVAAMVINDKTIYLRLESAPSGTSYVEYMLVCGRNRTTAA